MQTPCVAFFVTLLAATAACVRPAAAQNLVNGDFRNSNGHQIDGFTVVATPNGCAVPGSSSVSGDHDRSRALVLPAMPVQGTVQPVEIDCVAGVAQQVASLTPGDVYQITFRARSGFPTAQGNRLVIRLGDMELFDATVTSDTWYGYVTPGFLASSTSTRLVIEGRGGDSPVMVTGVMIRDLGPVTKIANAGLLPPP